MTTATLRVMDAHGGFSAPQHVAWSGGRFTAVGADGAASTGASAAHSATLTTPTTPATTPAADALPRTAGWVIPGLVDAHIHAAWHAFDAADRARLGVEQTRRATAEALARTLRAGVTSARDAGGLSVGDRDRIPAGERPRVACSVALIDRARADAAGGLDRAVEAVLEAGATWVKLVATAGVAAPAGAALEPHFSAAECASAVRRAESAGAAVMVHAWGGEAIDFAVAGGAASIEHGIFLTPEQAARAADAGTVFVPTLRIYRLVRGMIAAGRLPREFGPRVDRAVARHPNAVRIARDHGVGIALGTDYGTAAQHGANRLEFDALVAAGLSAQEALVAATRTGAALLARAPRALQAPDPAAPSGVAPTGAIAPGAVADAVLLSRDPREPGALSNPASIVGVLLDGRLIDPHLPSSSTVPREDLP
ncbi:amidohydrolase family protein [Leucobacter chromiiresistens]